MKQFSSGVLAAVFATTVLGFAHAGTTSNQGGPQSAGSPSPAIQGPAGIPQNEGATSDSKKSEDVSVDRDPAPRVPKVDKP
jgi:hypothetical protein